jgi:hypothetical protein
MREPFIFVSNPGEYHYAEHWGASGVETVRQQGCHAIFAARVPFIPSFMTSDFVRTLVGGGKSRIDLITERQIRFINDLINARFLAGGAVAFDLRFIARPALDSDKPSQLEIVFLGKVFHANRNQARELCRQLWRKFIAHYPLEDPFNYPLEAIEESQLDRYLYPIPVEQIGGPQLLEIRKYEDSDPYVGAESNSVGYYPHPFRPTFDATALGRFLEALAQQRQLCIASVCIQPTALFPEELRVVNQMISSYTRMSAESGDGRMPNDPRATEAQELKAQSWLNMYRKERYADIHSAFWPLINQRDHLFKIKIQVLGEQEAPADLLEALGSELIENSTAELEPRRWARERPETPEDVAVARYNFYALEQCPWGPQRLDATAQRLRFLVSATEAAGAFRLPIPPESGYLPGLEVRDEPFVLPHESADPPDRAVVLGEIIHRGQPSGQHFRLSVRELTRHGLVAGSTGTGKTNTCLWLLSQLWKQHHIPFLVMYPIDKPDYRILMADPPIRDQLLIFTAGDDRTAPFRFNPFAVAEGILLRTHMSLLMRCFSAAFSMWDPLPAVYRAAIRQVYADRGWDVVNGVGGDSGTRVPTMADFYETLVAVATEMTKDYGREAQGNIRQGSEIRIRDLLMNMGSVVNAAEPAPIAELLKRPTVMELGRVGSTEDTALLMGFLLMLLSEQLQSNLRRLTRDQRKQQIHITLVEEAHRLMAAGAGGGEHSADPRSKGGEDFSNLLAEVRGFGEGILIAEQIPVNLVQGAIGNTDLKIMHWLEDQRSFELFCDIMNLDDRQQDYARTLQLGNVLVRDRSGRPVHLQVANYLDSFQDDSDQSIVDDSDQAVRAFMQQHGRIAMPAAQPWAPAAAPQKAAAPLAPASLPAPLAPFCDGPACAAVLALPQAALTEQLRAIATAANQQSWQQVAQLCMEQIQKHGLPADVHLARCYLARIASLTQSTGPQAGKFLFDAFPFYRDALEHFPLEEAKTG